MQPTLCSKCKKNLAVIFISRIENGVTKNEGLCLKCAREMGVQPVDDMMKRMGITDEDLDNLTDEMIRVMAEKGGLVGLNYCAGFLDDQPSPDLCRSTTALMAKHAAHFKQVGGIEIIGLGSDFDGIGGKLELSDCSKMPLLADALRKEGFTEDEVEAIFFRNAQRFFENNL